MQPYLFFDFADSSNPDKLVVASAAVLRALARYGVLEHL